MSASGTPEPSPPAPDAGGGEPLSWVAPALARRRAEGLYRQMPAAELLPGGRVRLAGRELLNCASNDYLGLSPRLRLPPEANWPAGAGASRLIAGNHPLAAALEARLAALEGSEAALLFGSGYLANLGVIPALVGRDDVILADYLNHASLVDGARLSRAQVLRYRHGDLGHLDDLLRQHAGARRKLIVTDSVFSMDGDLADLPALVALKERHGAMMLVDEAHAGGVLGPAGAGLVAAHGLQARVELRMGTLSKAYGVYGAYVAGPRLLVDYLVNHARSLIYSTGLPPVLLALAHQALDLAAQADAERAHLASLAATLRASLRGAGVDIGGSACHIVPVLLGSSQRALAVSEAMREGGVAALAIRPPTVPPGTARLRLSLSAAHQTRDLTMLTELLLRVLHSQPPAP